jgi:hypothetical protein
MGVRVTYNHKNGRWVCKGPQGHVGKGSTRTAAMVAYSRRSVSGVRP